MPVTRTSGSAAGISGNQIKDNTITGRDVDEFSLIMPHFTTHKYSLTSSNSRVLVRFNAAGSDLTSSGQVNNKFVAPANGNLVMVKFRSTGTPGQTEIALMKISDGTEKFGDPGVPVGNVSINAASANTVYTASFTSNNSFNANDVLGIRIHPVNSHGNVDITCVWELDFSS